MISFKRLLFTSLLFACITFNPETTYALGEKGTAICALSGGAAVGALASGLTYMADSSVPAHILIPVGLAVAGVSSWVLHKILLKLKSKYAIIKARKIFDGVLAEANYLLSRDFSTINLDEYQLSIVHTQLDMQINKCQEALRLIEIARLGCKKNDVMIIDECTNLEFKGCSLMELLRSQLKSIVYSENFNNDCAKIQKLNDALHDIEQDSCISFNFSTSVLRSTAGVKPCVEEEMSQDLINYINIHFDKRWPLVLAHDRVILLAKSLSSIEQSVQKIELTLGAYKAEDAKKLAIACQELYVRTKLLIPAFSNKANLISAHKDYKFQVGLYENERIAEKQRRHAEDLAKEQLRIAEKIARAQAERQEELARQQRDLTEKLAREQKKLVKKYAR